MLDFLGVDISIVVSISQRQWTSFLCKLLLGSFQKLTQFFLIFQFVVWKLGL